MLGYESFLCHLVGDYWLQNNWMARNKKKDWLPAIVHGIIYTLPFLLLTQSWLALLVICVTHIIIDHTHIVSKLNQIKNWDFKQETLYLEESSRTISSLVFKDGYTKRPMFIRVWLIIIQDNILHLVINYLSLLYL